MFFLIKFFNYYLILIMLKIFRMSKLLGGKKKERDKVSDKELVCLIYVFFIYCFL